jgi:hypothetical protein
MSLTAAEIFVREVLAHSRPPVPMSEKIFWGVAYITVVLAVASVLLAFPHNVYAVLD